MQNAKVRQLLLQSFYYKEAEKKVLTIYSKCWENESENEGSNCVVQFGLVCFFS